MFAVHKLKKLRFKPFLAVNTKSYWRAPMHHTALPTPKFGSLIILLWKVLESIASYFKTEVYEILQNISTHHLVPMYIKNHLVMNR